MKKLIVLLCCLSVSTAFADFHCVVNVNRVLVYGDGSINVLHDGRNDFTFICNLRGTWKGIDTVTCAMWASLLQNTQNNEVKAIFYYDGTGSCAALPTYGASPAPVYIGTVK